MDEAGLLDLANRKGKAPGGYQEYMSEARLPLIFMNAVGTQSDVETLLHEGGHAFNAFATRGEWLSTYRHPPMEFSEVPVPWLGKGPEPYGTKKLSTEGSKLPFFQLEGCQPV